MHVPSCFEERQQAAVDENNIVALSKDMGEPVSEQQAAAMINYLSSSSNGVVTIDDFERFWSPPEP